MSIEQKIAEILAENRDTSTSTIHNMEEEVDINDPCDGDEENPDAARNNVTSQEVGGVDMQPNIVTANAAPAEPSNLMGMKEHIDALVQGEDLSEEFKEKAAIIFEAAVLERVKEEVERIEELYNSRIDEELEGITEGLIDKIDGYLGYVVEQWTEQNEIALERGIKNDILESFVSDLKTLFENHYIDVPESKYDLVEGLEEEVQELKNMLDEQMKANIDLVNELNEEKVNMAVHQLTEGLTATDKERFISLIEELDVDDVETFVNKAQVIRESYFVNKAPTKAVGSVVTDTPITLSENVVTAPQMRGYLSVLDKLK